MKLVVCIMGQNCEKFIPMCLESVKEADAIVYCDGGSSDNTLQKIADFETEDCFIDKIFNNYDQEDKQMNGKQRNFYLNYSKENYKDWWCLVLDADEVVEDGGIKKIKEFINTIKDGEDILFSPRMRHLIGDLSHEDATKPVHNVLHRLFKIRENLEYPLQEHPVLKVKDGETRSANYLDVTIWHMAYCPNMWSHKKRYENHKAKSQIHTPEFLKKWYHAHIFGRYPKSQFNPLELPKVITDEFLINRDELYFANRGLETKHFIDAIHWRDFFNCKTAIEFGCGRGPRVFAMNNIGIATCGIELSVYAVKNKIHERICCMDLLDNIERKESDLVIAYDVLEHIDYKDLDIAINNLIKTTNKYILLSVPFKRTPNCEADPTHIIKEDRDWWIKQFTDKGLKLIKTPDHFLFKEQILIFEKCN